MQSVDDLLEAELAGDRLRFLFFWSHQPSDRLGPQCFSQWYPSPFTVDGVHYATAEHWMMAEKARLFGDDRAVEEILASSHPGEAKQIGRTVGRFDEDTWIQARRSVAVAGNVAKFEQHVALGSFLRETSERILVEASPADLIWGIGLAADDPRAARPSEWRGSNLLGFALMEARDRLS